MGSWAGWAAAGLAAAGLWWAAGGTLARAQCCGGNHKPKGLTCVVEPECGIYDKSTAPRVVVNGRVIYLCSRDCIPKLKAAPYKYLKTSLRDPVTGGWFKPAAATPRVERKGVLYLFGSPTSKATFDKDPAKYAKP